MLRSGMIRRQEKLMRKPHKKWLLILIEHEKQIFPPQPPQCISNESSENSKTKYKKRVVCDMQYVKSNAMQCSAMHYDIDINIIDKL